MAYYDVLRTAWNSATQPPAGVTGTGLTGGMTTAQKIAAVNGWTVIHPQPAVLTPSQIINAIVPADLAALAALPVSIFTLVLQGNTVDASAGTTTRTAIQTIFSGKTQTLSNLAALVAPFDNAVQSWCGANGYATLDATHGNLNVYDANAAGLV